MVMNVLIPNENFRQWKMYYANENNKYELLSLLYAFYKTYSNLPGYLIFLVNFKLF